MLAKCSLSVESWRATVRNGRNDGPRSFQWQNPIYRKRGSELRRRVASVTMAPPHDVDQMMMWRQRIASENEMCLMTAKERIAQGYDAIIANTRRAPAQVSKITPHRKNWP